MKTLGRFIYWAFLGMCLGIMIRFFYLQETPDQIWHTITSLFTG